MATTRLVVTKLENVLTKGYIQSPDYDILSWISFFPVQKGLDDARMVYNETSNGLNDTLWAPWFPLPTLESVELGLVPGTTLGDLDIGEMFLNFQLHVSVRKYTGVDLRKYRQFFQDPSACPDIAVWTRACMGLGPSPYFCLRTLLLCLETIQNLQNPHYLENLFRWDKVILNLPGMTSFDTTYPWVYKWDDIRQCVAAAIKSYMDDVRLMCFGNEYMRKLLRFVASQLQYSGIQDAARKRTNPHHGTVPWAGTISGTTSSEVTRTVSQER